YTQLSRTRARVCSRIILYYNLCLLNVFFFFSSRRRHTRFKCDWSSDVCSSDLSRSRAVAREQQRGCGCATFLPRSFEDGSYVLRSEERRVGKECRCRWLWGDVKKKGSKG